MTEPFAAGHHKPHDAPGDQDPPGESTTDTAWLRKCRKDVLVEETGTPPEGQVQNIPAVVTSQNNLANGTPEIIRNSVLAGSHAQHAKAESAIAEWTGYANVAFVRAESLDESKVRIQFDSGDDSWSHVGRQNDTISRDEATMNPACLDTSETKPTATKTAAILHEFGHVLGMLHEHRSLAHSKHAVIDVDATLRLYRETQGLTDQQIREQVIDVSNFS